MRVSQPLAFNFLRCHKGRAKPRRSVVSHRRFSLVLTALAVLLAALLQATYAAPADEPQMLVTATNPEPQKLPTLAIWEDDKLSGGKKLTMVAATFSNVPGLICDSWCYESAVDFLGARGLEGGKLELRHRFREHPHVLLVTTVTPEPGAVEFMARAELENESAGALPANLPAPNLCWQLRRASPFASAPEPYPEFVKRCFIFTERGRTFLHQTARRKIPVRPPEDLYNNPPWVQMYAAAWQEAPQANTNSWADYSPDRYTTSVIGAVSRDGQYLAALASDSATVLAQAWHDCLHNNPPWLPADAPSGQRAWRLKVYAMENNPEALLARAAQDFPNARHRKQSGAPAGTFQTLGVKDNLPVFRDQSAERLTFPLSWLSGNYQDFAAWRQVARAKVFECLLKPPPSAPFEPVALAEQERGSYVARKIAFHLTADSRVSGFLLVPKGKGPFPAVLLLHDHGAQFDIGKEKVIQPWDDRPERLKSAREWVDKYYGGRFIGDELAKRGYVCFATDALNWSDRGGAGYEGQQALAGNLLHLGMSFAGLIAWEDLRAAEFLAGHPEVDGRRVAAMGLSMGAFRTWQVAALSDHIAGGVAICWLATVKGLMVPGNNQTRGLSAYTMTHPGLFNHLDYADVASLACPKPMLFYNGEQDALFPVPAVREAYAKLRHVWASQNAGDRLETRLWNVPHVFSREMQDEAFAWLEKNIKNEIKPK